MIRARSATGARIISPNRAGNRISGDMPVRCVRSLRDQKRNGGQAHRRRQSHRDAADDDGLHESFFSGFCRMGARVGPLIFGH